MQFLNRKLLNCIISGKTIYCLENLLLINHRLSKLMNHVSQQGISYSINQRHTLYNVINHKMRAYEND